MPAIKESDWKILRHLHAVALNRFSQRVLGEIELIAHAGERTHHERYLEIYKLIHEHDRRMGELFDNPRRSVAVIMLARLRAEELLTEEEYLSLSPETREQIECFLAH